MANAVLDNVDGILLGAETLRGRHPVATVDTILHICKQAEKVFDFAHHFDRLMSVSVAPLACMDNRGTLPRVRRFICHACAPDSADDLSILQDCTSGAALERS